MALPDALLCTISFIGGGIAYVSYLFAQAPGAGTTISGGAISVGIVAIITALSPLILGAMDRKKLRESLAQKTVENAALRAENRRLQRHVIEDATKSGKPLPPWFFGVPNATDLAGTAEHETIPDPPEGLDP
jgi:hypothetical protein